MSFNKSLMLEHEIREYLREQKARLDEVIEANGDSFSTPDIAFELDGIEPMWRVSHYRYTDCTTRAAQLTDAVTIWCERYTSYKNRAKLPSLIAGPSNA